MNYWIKISSISFLTALLLSGCKEWYITGDSFLLKQSNISDNILEEKVVPIESSQITKEDSSAIFQPIIEPDNQEVESLDINNSDINDSVSIIKEKIDSPVQITDINISNTVNINDEYINISFRVPKTVDWWENASLFINWNYSWYLKNNWDSYSAKIENIFKVGEQIRVNINATDNWDSDISTQLTTNIITIIDKTSPIINISETNSTIYIWDDFILPEANATDNSWEVLELFTKWEVDITKPWDNNVTFSAKDTSSNETNITKIYRVNSIAEDRNISVLEKSLWETSIILSENIPNKVRDNLDFTIEETDKIKLDDNWIIIFTQDDNLSLKEWEEKEYIILYTATNNDIPETKTINITILWVNNSPEISSIDGNRTIIEWEDAKLITNYSDPENDNYDETITYKENDTLLATWKEVQIPDLTVWTHIIDVYVDDVTESITLIVQAKDITPDDFSFRNQNFSSPNQTFKTAEKVIIWINSDIEYTIPNWLTFYLNAKKVDWENVTLKEWDKFYLEWKSPSYGSSKTYNVVMWELNQSFNISTSAKPNKAPTISMTNQTVDDNWGAIPTDLDAPVVSNVKSGAIYEIVNNPTWWNLTINSDNWIMTWNWNTMWPWTDYNNIEIKITNPDWGNKTTTFDLHVNNNA